MIEQSLHFPGHALTSMAIVAALAMGGMLLYLWRLHKTVSRRDAWILGALRLLAVVGILGAFVQPTRRVEEVARRRSKVVVLVDESMSMRHLGSGNRSYAEQVSSFFRLHADRFAALEEKHEVSYWAFATRVRAIERAKLEAVLPSTGGSTDLAGAIREVLKGVSPGDVGGILVFTDGADNAELARLDASGESAAAASIPAGPVYGFLPEANTALPDVVLWDVSGIDYVVSRDLAECSAEVKLFGVDSEALQMTLTQGGEVISTAAFDASTILEGGLVSGTFFPREPGRSLVEVSLSSAGHEVSQDNNRRMSILHVVRDRVRVLHVAGHPSWDQRFLRDYFRRRNDTEVVSFHTLRAPDTVLSAADEDTTLIPFPAEELFGHQIEGFDLIILQDYDLAEADPERLAENLETFVNAGGAVLFVGGNFSFGARGIWPTHLGRLLPVGPARPLTFGMVEQRLGVAVVDAVRHHPVFRLPGLLDRIDAARITAVNRTEGIGKGAQVLLEARESQDGTGVRWPLLVVESRQRGRVAAILTDSLWRWSFDPAMDATWRGLMDGLVAWLTRDPLAHAIRVQAMQPEILPGEVQSIMVSGSPEVGKVTLSLERQMPGGEFESVGEVHVADLADNPQTEVRMAIPETGGYRVVVRPEKLGSEEAHDVFVAAPRLQEMRQTQISGEFLDRLRRDRGGEVMPLSHPSPACQ